MIYHTVCDPLYFDRFFFDFYKSIKKYSPDSSVSIHYVGTINELHKKFCDENNILFSHESTTIEDLREQFKGVDDGNLLGYYPLARWFSIPLIDEDVCVCDVDLLAINPIDENLLKELLSKNNCVNITRVKPSGEIGGMMLMCLNKNVLKNVKEFASSHKNKISHISIAEDVKVRTFIYETCNPYHLNGKMLDVTKPKETDSGEWFVFSKGGQGETSIRKKEKIERFLNE